MLNNLLKEFKEKASPEKAKASAWFFKTEEGQYGHGDQFIGLTVPVQRQIAKKYQTLPLTELEKLISSPIHEHRLTALFILVGQYQKASEEKTKQKLVDFYLDNLKWVNNWDLVDSSAPYILGNYFLKRDKDLFYKLAKSTNLWEKRIAMVGVGGFIREGKLEDVLKVAEILINDREDLIQKAVGWMLREIGNRNLKIEEDFLNKHYQQMPRTMLRYAIEKFSPSKKAFYMKKS